MSPKPRTVHQCQYQNARGHRCNMLIDQSHRPEKGASRPALCAYHAGRLRSSVPAVDPEALAADLLGDINDFSTASSINLFLGNLVKQLARKRIARRDAIALAYISQLLLNSLPALERAAKAERAAQKDAAIARFNALLSQQNRERAARCQQQAAHPPQAAPADTGNAAVPVVAGL